VSSSSSTFSTELIEDSAGPFGWTCRRIALTCALSLPLPRAPISKVIGYLPPNIPRILINRTIVHPAHKTVDENCIEDDDEEEEFREDYVFDAYLLGFCDDVTRALAKVLFSSASSEEDTAKPSAQEDTATTGHLLASLMKNVDKTNKDDRGDGGEEQLHKPQDWSSVQVPHERVFLFPGAIPPAGSNDDDITYREIAHCDGCSQRIQGTIHKCICCFDYDLCTKCYPGLSKKHYNGKHDFASEAAVQPLIESKG
jgi:hypothetical protein